MKRQEQASNQTGFTLDARAAAFPFGREFSLEPLIAAWESLAARAGTQGELARAVRTALERAPELRGPVQDPTVLARHPDLVEALMSLVFPPAAWAEEYVAATVPFQMRAVAASPGFRRLLLDAEGEVRGRVNLDARAYTNGRLLHAFDVVLRKYHDVALELDYPVIYTVDDPESGLERHFRIQFDKRFLEVRARRPVRPLGPAERARLLANPTDVGLLAELVPPEDFVFTGFVVVRAADVTDQEVLSGLKRDLIDRESIVSDERFRGLQQRLRTLFRRPDLRLGLAAFQGGRVFVLNYGCRIEHGCIFADSEHRRMEDFAGSVYERAVRQGSPLIVEDLAAEGAAPTRVEEALLDLGIRNVVVAPLHYQDRVIGTLQLGSPRPGDLTPMSLLKLREVLPLFSMAVRRSLDELEARVQAVIKERCTAIHPSVEWRFRRAVLDTIERRGQEAADLEPIVFRDVYPLYAATDIRGSSVQRNAAVQADLGAHLRLALDVVEAARAARPLPALDETAYRIERHADHIARALSSGDEVTVLAFLRQHVEPLFPTLARFGPAVRRAIDAYRAALDPGAGTVHRQRRAYEESMALLVDTIAGYLEAEENLAQAMVPHYFERQRTDGVDHMIYVGRSLVEDGEFDELHLRSLRLWQLIVTCGIARRTAALRPRLSVPLETTHLVLAHLAPLSIRFRSDEKRFDVEGAYDVRYEVIKKRIDKAVVHGTGERVTQPGRLAVVYSQPAEGEEYRRYLEYLGARGHVRGEVEDLELGELQGVQGLRALRVAIDLTTPEAEPSAAALQAEAGGRALAG